MIFEYLQWGIVDGSHYWGCSPGTLSCSQVSATHLKIRHPLMKFTGAWSSNEVQRLDLKKSTGSQSSDELRTASQGTRNGHQSDMSYWSICFMWPRITPYLPTTVSLCSWIWGKCLWNLHLNLIMVTRHFSPKYSQMVLHSSAVRARYKGVVCEFTGCSVSYVSLWYHMWYRNMIDHIDRPVQERCNSSALAMELCLSCTNPSIS